MPGQESQALAKPGGGRVEAAAPYIATGELRPECPSSAVWDTKHMTFMQFKHFQADAET